MRREFIVTSPWTWESGVGFLNALAVNKVCDLEIFESIDASQSLCQGGIIDRNKFSRLILD